MNERYLLLGRVLFLLLTGADFRRWSSSVRYAFSRPSTEPMLPAETVRGGTELLVIGLGVAVVFPAGICVDGIKDQVGVDMLFVYMYRNNIFY